MASARASDSGLTYDDFLRETTTPPDAGATDSFYCGECGQDWPFTLRYTHCPDCGRPCRRHFRSSTLTAVEEGIRRAQSDA